MFVKYLLLLLVLDFINADFSLRYSSNCPTPRLAHGSVRVRQKSKLARFSCNYPFMLMGNRYTVCKNGRWDEPLPVCIRPGCPTLPVVSNSVHLDSHNHAWVVFFCLPGHKLIGSTVLYCDGSQWNATVPTCVSTSGGAQLSCDFESPQICGWTQDELHDFDWFRLNEKTPSSFLFTGPSYDHTLGPGQTGSYMYIESTSRMENNTARLLSPVYDKNLTSNGCFSFYYHMWGRYIGGLRVYQKPDSLPLYTMLNLTDSEKQKYILFEQWGNQGNMWYGAVSPLRNITEDFQIVIEGIRGESFTSDIAIDDVAILQGENCTLARSIAPTPAPFIAESCSGRCGLGTAQRGGCGCTEHCFMEEDCCTDYMELCMFNSNSKQADDDVTTAVSILQPQTQKLVAITTHSTTISTTPETTTSTTTVSTSTTPSTTPSTTITSTTSKPTTSTTRKAVTKASVTKATTTKATVSKAPTTLSSVTKTTKNLSVHNEIVSKKKLQEEIETAKLLRPDVKVESGHSGAKTAAITIVSLCVFACAVYLAVWLRGSRAREAFARLRGTVARDQEVRYLNADVDDD